MIVAVDLAAKYSAACIMDHYGEVIEETDSWKLNEDDFLEWITSSWDSRDYDAEIPDVLVIEDLPHKLPFMKITKKVCRLQGRIEEKMISFGSWQEVLFVPPQLWQKSYGIKGRETAKLVLPKAEHLGYRPPYDYTEYKGTDRQTARKVNSDYCAAYLIARWAYEYNKEHGTYDAPTTARFE